jgi:hypothetical protein
VVFAAAVLLLAAVSARTWPPYPGAVLLGCAGARHAASYSPLFARLGARAGAAHGSALSALGNTGALLASAIGIAGIGALYLTATAAPGHAHNGLAHVAIALSAVLALTAVCAGLAQRPSTDPDR